MKKDKIIPIHNGMERIRIYTVDDVFQWIKDRGGIKEMEDLPGALFIIEL